ncbi:MAG: ADP-heptose--LPS heptosyltransferase [Oceanicaulis sp.]|uniref:glycosyltransferase family 9 protein n=1 Tax=Oceanicaulis sp. UBA2681 TaxID=1947007 RepID=UPI000C0A8920|nr:glycosyltransferase family 9 protein [Oceanicaulis sp. UBA2681]MAP49224.1 ADP-heptose--LPS heptosyltransferase [Oceanicaulis sp.]HCR65747.1 glycosyltransferase family 9 protein [Oceanicaulis sp.]|tara:strand:+ start:314 stop:1276 length:963 start_codon:yes stop_codon:yes gene_type:complete
MTRILFITSTRIGDAILNSGVLQHLIDKHADARITVACGPLAAPLFRATPKVERVIVMKKQKGGGHWLSLWRQSVSQRWDMVVDMRGSLTSWFLWARKRYVKRPNPKAGVRHRVEEAADVLRLDAAPGTRIWLDAAAEARADRELPADRAVLALSPAASAVFKEWPTERFAQLALRLTAPDGVLPGAAIALFGGPGDEARAQAVAEGLGERTVIDLTGKLDLVEAAACLKRAALFVGNDSGLMHMAAAAGTPTLGLFGPTDERLYAPWGARACIVRAGDRFDEADRRSLADTSTQSLMGALSVEAAERAALALLAETADA